MLNFNLFSNKEQQQYLEKQVVENFVWLHKILLLTINVAKVATSG